MLCIDSTGSLPHAGAVPPIKPLIDLENYVPRAITVVRRSQGWPGIFLQERRGGPGSVSYTTGIRQHALYCFTKPMQAKSKIDGKLVASRYRVGETRFVTAGRPAEFHWASDVELLILGFEPWFFERVAAELGGSATLPLQAHEFHFMPDHPVSTLVRLIERELDLLPGSSEVAEGLARAIAVNLLREFHLLPGKKPADLAPPVAVLRAVELMRHRLAESLPIEELAGAAGLSPFHFARQFKAATGYPPHEYLIRLRIDRARELLEKNGRTLTMAAIAHDCGFADQSHLARHFKRVLGVTPGVFVG